MLRITELNLEDLYVKQVSAPAQLTHPRASGAPKTLQHIHFREDLSKSENSALRALIH